MTILQFIKRHWRQLLLAFLLVATTVAFLAWLSFWRITSALMEQQSKSAEIVLTPLTDHLYMIDAKLGDRQIGASLLASVGSDGVLLVDVPMTRALSEKVGAALEQLEPHFRGEGLTVVNTHAHPDHARGNRFLAETTEILAHEKTRQRLAQSPRPFPLLPAVPPLDSRFLPSRTFETTFEVSMNGETVTLLHPGSAHTDGDVVVLFEGSKVAHLGDLFHGVGGHPGIDWRNSGGDALGMVESLDLLLARLPDDVILVGGHGGIGQVWSKGDLGTYRDLVSHTTGFVRSLIAEGRTLEEVLEIGVPTKWESWFENRRGDSVMHGPPLGLAREHLPGAHAELGEAIGQRSG